MMKILVLLPLLLVLAACATQQEALAPPDLIRSPAAQMDTAVVTRGDLLLLVRRTGVTRYVSQPLYFVNPIASFYEFHVSVGDAVTAGQLLATLDIENITEQIEEQTERIANMRRDHNLQVQIRQVDIDIMQFEHINRINQAAHSLDPDVWSTAEAGQGAIAMAELELTQFIERHNFQLRQAEMRLADLQTRSQSAQLLAPFDGEITYMAPLRQGNSIGVMQPLLFITDKSQVIVEAINLVESDWPQPGPGGMPPDPWRPNLVRHALDIQGEIAGEHFHLEYIPLGLHERPQRHVRFNVIGTNQPPAGQYVVLHFYGEQMRDVILVPDNAMFFAGGQAYVYVIENGEMIYREITLAGRTSIQGAVAYGLAEGEVVFVR